MADETKTAGTPAQDDGDGASAQTGTPAADDRDAGSDGASAEPDYKRMYLDSKSAVEERNRLKAELDEIRSSFAQPPAASEADPEPSRKVDWKRVEEWAEKGDEVARAQLENRREQQLLARSIADSFQLRDIEDNTERQEVYQHYIKNQHRLGDVKAARAELRESRLAIENEQLRKEVEALRKSPPADVIRTHGREVPSKEAKTRKMTYEQFDSEVARLKSEGQFREAMALQNKLAKGEIDIP